jgi:hypothetical protein
VTLFDVWAIGALIALAGYLAADIADGFGAYRGAPVSAALATAVVVLAWPASLAAQVASVVLGRSSR